MRSPCITASAGIRTRTPRHLPSDPSVCSSPPLMRPEQFHAKRMPLSLQVSARISSQRLFPALLSTMPKISRRWPPLGVARTRIRGKKQKPYPYPQTLHRTVDDLKYCTQ